ncbi:GNAT family N-acetyltransferase [Amycolatopsis alkalitolerans]|uniref:GNAT family N-acetyltransferase n=1 Tax=Amycolatopsis alkalitolerans TaxID=2547244 RepID=A0A5C4LWP1_9PSEU|nr:GNAT family protein [Amycolatopsis alkalitolerans]TNC22633.1 GNAT family N-acetyltransferase [Amycolatopsis alkalitolerans]
MLQPTYPVQTPRLNLRPLASTDLTAFHAMYSHPEVVRHLTWEPQGRIDTRELLARKTRHSTLAEPGQTLSLAIVLVETGEVIGDVSLGWLRGEHDNGDVIIVLHPRHQGKGYGAEACAEILRLGFEGLRLHQIFGACDARDIASASLMEGLGMRHDPGLREREHLKPKWDRELVYSMLATEWRRR